MHFIPDFYRDALALTNMASPDGINALRPWDEENFLRVMDKLQIETAILSIYSPGVNSIITDSTWETPCSIRICRT